MVRVLRESVWNLGRRKSRCWQSISMRLPTPSASATRRAVLAALTSTALLPLQAPADSAIPTYSLKGVPGLSSITGADAPRPSELGVLGKGQKGDKTGRLQFCEKKGCISSFSPPDQDSYVPPWTYDADFQTGAISPKDARRAALKAAALAEKAEKDGQEAAARRRHQRRRHRHLPRRRASTRRGPSSSRRSRPPTAVSSRRRTAMCTRNSPTRSPA